MSDPISTPPHQGGKTLSFEIVPFDALHASAEEIAQYIRFVRLRDEQFWPSEPRISDAEFEHLLRRQFPVIRVVRYVAWTGEDIAGILVMDVRREGTPEYELRAPHISVAAWVLEAYQRQGVATALLGACATYMKAHDKTMVTMGTSFASGTAFLERMGARQTQQAFENRAP